MSTAIEFLQWSLSGGFFRFIGTAILLGIIFTPVGLVTGAVVNRVRG